MTQELIDVDGCRVSTRVVGSGVPAVVMLASAGGAHEDWNRLIPLLDTMCVTYGRRSPKHRRRHVSVSDGVHSL